MENKNKKLILDKIDELVELIKNTDDYKRYSFLKEEMLKNVELMKLIGEIKKIEQVIIKKEYYNEEVISLKSTLDSKKKELLEYPSYQEYLYLQEDINNQLQNIRSILENSFNKY